MSIKTRKVERLTEQQEAQLDPWRDQWLTHGLSTQPAVVVFVTGLVVHLLLTFAVRRPNRAARITYRAGRPPRRPQIPVALGGEARPFAMWAFGRAVQRPYGTTQSAPARGR